MSEMHWERRGAYIVDALICAVAVEARRANGSKKSECMFDLLFLKTRVGGLNAKGRKIYVLWKGKCVVVDGNFN